MSVNILFKDIYHQNLTYINIKIVYQFALYIKTSNAVFDSKLYGIYFNNQIVLANFIFHFNLNLFHRKLVLSVHLFT